METQISIQQLTLQEIKDICKRHLYGLEEIDIDCIKDTNIYDLIKTCSTKTMYNPHWGILASRIQQEEISKTTGKTFSESMNLLSRQMNPLFMKFVNKYSNELNSMIDEKRSEYKSSIQVATCMKSYLLRYTKEETGDVLWCGETIQQMFLRVAVFVFMDENPTMETWKRIQQMYDYVSLGYISMPSPALFSAGTKRSQMASCFLFQCEDNLYSIEDTYTAVLEICRIGGGIGLDMSRIRHSLIAQAGKSGGIPAMLPMFAKGLECIDQNKKRKGSAAINIRDIHMDCISSFDLRDPEGNPEEKCKDLNFCFYVSDLFMKKAIVNEDWHFFCPNKVPKLFDAYGKEFENLYHQYVLEEKYEYTLPARSVFLSIIRYCIRTGEPYLVAADRVNESNMLDNVGPVDTSNLCVEIVEPVRHWDGKRVISSCNLCSIPIAKFVENKRMNWDMFRNVLYFSVSMMDNVIDRTYYPDREVDIRKENEQMIISVLSKFDVENKEEIAKKISSNIQSREFLKTIKTENMSNRPLGIGIQALADAIAKFDWLFDSDEAHEFVDDVNQFMYYQLVNASCDLAQKRGAYPNFPGSAYSKGQLHPDRWTPPNGKKAVFSKRLNLDWDELRNKVKKGIRHSLLRANMPTATSSIISGYSPSTEPFNMMIGTKTILSGQHIYLCEEAYKDLRKLGVWNDNFVNEIISSNIMKDVANSYNDVTNLGGISNMEIPPEIKEFPLKCARFRYLQQKYKTAYELSPRALMKNIELTTPFICQSQSSNWHIPSPERLKIMKMFLDIWKMGAKTISYYVRSRASVTANNIAACKGDSCGS